MGKTHDDIIFDTFKSLLTTNNEEFETYINGLKSDWETQSGNGVNLSHDTLVTKSVAKYNNLVAQKAWNTSTSKNAKLVAMATQVKNLEKQLSDSKDTKNTNTGKQTQGKKPPIAEWRFKKSFGSEVEKDDRKWYWCHHQHNDGKGMYVTHKPEDHVTWSQNRKNKKGKKNSAENNNKDLQLTDKLKAALVTKFKCSEDEAKKLIDSVISGN